MRCTEHTVSYVGALELNLSFWIGSRLLQGVEVGKSITGVCGVREGRLVRVALFRLWEGRTLVVGELRMKATS